MGRYSIRVIGVLLICAALVSGCSGSAPTPAGTKVEPPPAPKATEPEKPDGPLTGLKTDPDIAKRRPIAVMIDNSPKARPQQGLNEASVVFEMLAEGGITRYMAVYLEGDAETLGPVRSARHYFVYAAAGLGAVYSHCGGSPQAYSEISSMKLNTLDDMKDSGIYVRSKERVAPHNLYTSTEVLRREMARRGLESTPAGLPMWKWADEPGNGKPATRVSIPYPGGYEGYGVAYEYDSASKRYLRSVAGKPHVDAKDGKQLAVSNVLVLFIKNWPIPKDKELRIDMAIVGKGEGMLVSAGVERAIKWSKQSKTAPFEFTESSGEKLSVQRGNVFIQVVPLETKVSING